jgi:hypothetical protein
VGERISIAAEMIMAHLSIMIRISHASQKKDRWAVGKQSLPVDITRASGFSRRMEDQIEMTQFIRGRIGDDRDAVLAVQYRLNCGRAERPPSCDMEPASKRARVTVRRRHNAVTVP